MAKFEEDLKKEVEDKHVAEPVKDKMDEAEGPSEAREMDESPDAD